MSARHTPTPYYAEPTSDGNPGIYSSVTGALVAEAWRGQHESGGDIAEDELDANAAFIVRACNSHDALVETVALALAWSEDGSPDSERGPLELQMRASGLAALKLARGES